MTITAKICGITTEEAVDAAAAGGAGFLGFNFYPPSPRHLSAARAAHLAARAPRAIRKVGLFVDACDDEIARILDRTHLDLLQLHGRESPARAAEIRARFGLPVMKAIPVASAADVARAGDYAPAVDMLLFDAKPPREAPGALPGGNGLAFDWALIANFESPLPWMLSGGLDARCVAEAVRVSSARMVDVSSGVEDRPGHKDPALIRGFLAALETLEPAEA